MLIQYAPARIVLILQLAHDALVSNTVLTKRSVTSAAMLKLIQKWLTLVFRSIFYQHQDLFETQKVVDQLVDDIAITLNLDRGDLNIVSMCAPCKPVAKSAPGSISKGYRGRPIEYPISGRGRAGRIIRGHGS